VDKVRFDYARVLISTSSSEIVNTDAKILVDGEIFDFKIIEDWGIALGEDACLDENTVQQGENGPM
jgi:hypothetical protein